MNPAIAIFFDEDLRAKANRAGSNYWHVYTREICRQLGLMHQELSRSQLTEERLQDFRVLILPDLPPEYLRPAEKQLLFDWTQAGGLLIGFATGGLGPLFGHVVEGELPQREDAFTPTATLRFVEAQLARSVMFPGDEDLPLLIVSPVKLLAPAKSPALTAQARSEQASATDLQELGRLMTLQGRDLRRPAITWRAVGAGQALYFAFNLPQTIWALHHGRPVQEDYDGDGMLRMSDAMIMRPFPTSVPYADMLLYLLRNVMARQGVPFIHALPPTPEGDIPDCLFHYGGDDEGQPHNQLIASAVMKELGLGYHINLMPNTEGRFALSREEYAQLKANGHEPSLHFNFIDGVSHPYKFSRQEIQQQVDAYVQAFGERPICTVFHWTTWHGWTEVAEWLSWAGVQADNSRFAQYCPPANPVNTVGFGFGTALPYFHYTDFRKDNERINLLALPICGYEVGYRGEAVEFHVLKRAIDMARFWHVPFNLFYHPVYLAQYPACRQALEQGLKYMAQLGLKVMHWGNDRLTLWWRARSQACIESVSGAAPPAEERPASESAAAGLGAQTLSWRVVCEWETGCIVQRLWEAGEPRVEVDGEPARYVLREEYGGRWLYVALPPGAHLLHITAAAAT